MMSALDKIPRQLEKQLADFRTTVRSSATLERARASAEKAARKAQAKSNMAVKGVGSPNHLAKTTATPGRSILEPSSALAPAYIHNAEDLALALRAALYKRRTRMSKIAETTGCHRKTVESLLSGEGNPTFEVITKVADAAGLVLCLQPKSQT